MFKKQLIPLSSQEKDLIVYRFLVENNFDFSNNSLNDYEVSNYLMSTPQYTLVNSLEFLCVFFRNKSFRNNTIAFAQENYEIDLTNPRFTQGYLINLAEYFCYSRFLDSKDIQSLKLKWQEKLISDNFIIQDFYKVCTWWVYSIVQSLQIYELIDNADKKLTKKDKESIMDSLSYNDKLMQYYLKSRSIKS